MSSITCAFALSGLMILPAVVPTIRVLQELSLSKTLHGMILIQVAYGLGFIILLYRNFIRAITREHDEAAIIDVANPWQVFFGVVLPLLQPVTPTVIVVQSISIFNDFTHPLYYLPGAENITFQLTLYNFQSEFRRQINLLFMNCGKSTLLRMLPRLEEQTPGSIEIGGRDVTQAKPSERGIVMVLQNYALYPTSPCARVSASASASPGRRRPR